MAYDITLSRQVENVSQVPISVDVINLRRVKELIPIMVFVGLLSMIGMVGNAFVVFLFSTKFKKATSAFFIMWLGILDFIVCSVGMPFEIVDMLFSYTFTYEIPCKVMRFFIFFVVYSSALTLIVVAFDRFVKVCYPLKGWNVKPRLTLAVTTVLGGVFAIPVGLVYGTATTSTIEPGVNGTECSINDAMHGTVWPVVYYTSVGLIFVFSIFSLLVLYGKLVHSLVKRKQQMRRDSVWFNSVRTIQSPPPQEDARCDDFTKEQHNVHKDDGYESTDSAKKKDILRRKKTLKKIKRLRRRSNIMNYPGYFNIPTERTSVIFACVSVGFIVSYLPSLIIIVMRESMKDIEEHYLHSSQVSDLCYNFFIRFYFINHAINPIIYGFLNPSFRRECQRLVCPCIKIPEQVDVEIPLESISSSMQSGVVRNDVVR